MNQQEVWDLSTRTLTNLSADEEHALGRAALRLRGELRTTALTSESSRGRAVDWP